MSNPLSGNNQESSLQELQRRRELVAGYMSKASLSEKERAWEKEQLDDLDNAIRNLRSGPPSVEGEPRFF